MGIYTYIYRRECNSAGAEVEPRQGGLSLTQTGQLQEVSVLLFFDKYMKYRPIIFPLSFSPHPPLPLIPPLSLSLSIYIYIYIYSLFCIKSMGYNNILLHFINISIHCINVSIHREEGSHQFTANKVSVRIVSLSDLQSAGNAPLGGIYSQNNTLVLIIIVTYSQKYSHSRLLFLLSSHACYLLLFFSF